MANGKNVQNELREMARDDTVPMKTKVSMLAAGQADTYDLMNEVKEMIDKFMSDQGSRLIVIEEGLKTNTKEIDNLRKLSNRNDIIGSVSALAIAVLTALGLRN